MLARSRAPRSYLYPSSPRRKWNAGSVCDRDLDRVRSDIVAKAVTHNPYMTSRVEPWICVRHRRSQPRARKRRAQRAMEGAHRAPHERARHEACAPSCAMILSSRESQGGLSRPLLNLAERGGRASYPQFTATRGDPDIAVPCEKIDPEPIVALAFRRRWPRRLMRRAPRRSRRRARSRACSARHAA